MWTVDFDCPTGIKNKRLWLNKGHPGMSVVIPEVEKDLTCFTVGQLTADMGC